MSKLTWWILVLHIFAMCIYLFLMFPYFQRPFRWLFVVFSMFLTLIMLDQGSQPVYLALVCTPVQASLLCKRPTDFIPSQLEPLITTYRFPWNSSSWRGSELCPLESLYCALLIILLVTTRQTRKLYKTEE